MEWPLYDFFFSPAVDYDESRLEWKVVYTTSKDCDTKNSHRKQEREGMAYHKQRIGLIFRAKMRNEGITQRRRHGHSERRRGKTEDGGIHIRRRWLPL